MSEPEDGADFLSPIPEWTRQPAGDFKPVERTRVQAPPIKPRWRQQPGSRPVSPISAELCQRCSTVPANGILYTSGASWPLPKRLRVCGPCFGLLQQEHAPEEFAAYHHCSECGADVKRTLKLADRRVCKPCWHSIAEASSSARSY
jgi:hypothetical protein